MEAVLKREIITNKVFCRFFAVAASVVMISLGAYVRIPLTFTPVPLTLQTLFVLLSAALLGQRLGLAAQAGYVFLGASGVSIFSGTSSGGAYLLGPTGGYIAGFILAAIMIGKVIRYAGRNAFYVFGIFCFADLVILACGTLWLKAVLNAPLAQAARLGFIPFIPGDLLKIVVAVIAYLGLDRRVKDVL